MMHIFFLILSNGEEIKNIYITQTPTDHFLI